MQIQLKETVQSSAKLSANRDAEADHLYSSYTEESSQVVKSGFAS